MADDPDFRRGYFLARFGLGINIALHGWSRLPKFDAFLAKTQEQFAATVLPPGLVKLTCYGVVASESIVGGLLLLGLWTRFALGWGAGLMWVLIFGTCLVQNWTTAGDQLVYLAFFAVLFAFARYNSVALDTWRLRTVRSDPVNRSFTP
jgi:thiosulfate dehydrogenase [quinone] large subunit